MWIDECYLDYSKCSLIALALASTRLAIESSSYTAGESSDFAFSAECFTIAKLIGEVE